MATKPLLRQLKTIQILNFVGHTAKSSAAIKLTYPKLELLAKSFKSGDNKIYFHFYSTNKVNNIPVATYDEIKKLTKQSPQLLIDVREPEEVQELGKIAVSINIPVGQVEHELGSAINNITFKAKYGFDKPDMNKEIIFHCRSGKRSQKAAELARNLGYKNTKNYLGSWSEWAEKEGLPK